ncbi:hypothetical protein Q031_05856 [Pseudomonas aeruginosa BWHPSA018]|nr:hypothetical protein Q031_05856 [Pseudomonas aeruginosa BWHPSA018]
MICLCIASRARLSPGHSAVPLCFFFCRSLYARCFSAGVIALPVAGRPRFRLAGCSSRGRAWVCLSAGSIMAKGPFRCPCPNYSNVTVNALIACCYRTRTHHRYSNVTLIHPRPRRSRRLVACTPWTDRLVVTATIPAKRPISPQRKSPRRPQRLARGFSRSLLYCPATSSIRALICPNGAAPGRLSAALPGASAPLTVRSRSCRGSAALWLHRRSRVHHL